MQAYRRVDCWINRCADDWYTIIITRKSWVMGHVGHGSRGSWSVHWWVRWAMGHMGHESLHCWVRWVMVTWVMGQLTDGPVGYGSDGSWVMWVMGHGYVVHGSVHLRVRRVMGHVGHGSVHCWVDGSQNLTHCQLWYWAVHGEGKTMAHRKVSWWHGQQLEF